MLLIGYSGYLGYYFGGYFGYCGGYYCGVYYCGVYYFGYYVGWGYNIYFVYFG